MIVSHQHRFVFVKTRKTAGSSIEAALSPIAGPDAVVTPLLEELPDHRPRNWRASFNPVPELLANPRAARWTLKQWRRRMGFYSHLPADRARLRLGRDRWDEYFTFCFERDPWDKVTSMYFWNTRQDPSPPPFEVWVERRRRELSDWHLYTSRGRIIVDFVGRYERLEADLRAALDQAGVADRIELPRLKSGTRRGAVTFTPRAREIVLDVFAREFEAFGYPTEPASAQP
jgi:hypothetical protein